MLIKDVYATLLKKATIKKVDTSAFNELITSFLGCKNYLELQKKGDEEFVNYDSFVPLFERLLCGEPVQYILKQGWFYGNVFYVDQRVLIPRMETEELVELIIKENSNRTCTIIDVGTGSGAIAISLAKNLPHWRIFGSDISESALEVAKFNAERLETSVQFFNGDMLKPYIDLGLKCDIIVSNPPYINNGDEIDDVVKNHEPLLALIPPSGDGMEYYQLIIENGSKVLNSQGLIYFEIGENLRPRLEKYLRGIPNIKYTFIQDISSRDRILKIEIA